MRQLYKPTGAFKLKVQSGTKAQISPHPRATCSRRSMDRTVRLKDVKNLIVKCEAHTGTETFSLGCRLGVSSMNEL